MELCLKIMAGLLLLVHVASPQDSTASTGQGIDKSWLRGNGGSQNGAVPEEEPDYDATADPNAMESGNDYNSGIASGSMVLDNVDVVNVTDQDNGANEQSDVVTTTVPLNIQNVTTPTTATTAVANSSQINMTNVEEELHTTTVTPQNATTHVSAQNSTSFSDHSNHTDLQMSTLPSEGNSTHESTTKPKEDTWLSNTTESTSTTTETTTMIPGKNETSTTSSSSTVFVSETTEISPETTTADDLNTPEKVNRTDKSSSASGSSSERGLETDHHRSKRNGAWGAVLGTAVAVAFVGLVAYVILKKKHQKAFSHRKLVEEFPSDPVLRLDNSEPLDLNFGGSAYYNPGLQGDNIQMTNFPGRR